jgi:hypothetical protein
MTTQPGAATTKDNVKELRSLDDDVATYLEVSERWRQLGAELAAVRHRLADRGIGTHKTSSGIKVTVSSPNRRFNADKAWEMLTPAQRKLCVSPDSSKIRQQLPPVLAEECMEPGTGTPRVVVK